MTNAVIAVGDEPVRVLGKYALHIFRSGTGTAKLQSSHFPEEEDSWVDLEIYEIKTAEEIETAIVELAGAVRLTGTDTAAKCSLVQLPADC